MQSKIEIVAAVLIALVTVVGLVTLVVAYGIWAL
jgi:hypothetical protein